MTRSLLRVAPSQPVPTGGEVLTGAVPTLVVHRSYRHADQLPDLVTRAQAVCGTDAAVAIATRLPVQQPAAARSFLGAFPTAALRIADPEVHTLPGPAQAPHARATRSAASYAYAGSPTPAAPTATWVRDVLDAQFDAGANIMLSASGWVDAAAGAQNLATAMAFVDATRTELGADDPMFVNLTLHQAWLRNPTLRDAFLQEVVESSEELWWVRVMWPPLRPTNYSQLVDGPLLEGYRALAQVARDEGKTLILPNSGLTGWVATALGASGFSTGMSGAERAYLDQPPQGGGAAGAPRERYFEPNVLHTILNADRPPLARATGYQPCTCAYCGRLNGRAWQQPLEHVHYLLAAADLTRQLGRAGRQASALTVVQAAQAFKSTLTGPARLTGESDPRHLDAWEDALR